MEKRSPQAQHGPIEIRVGSRRAAIPGTTSAECDWCQGTGRLTGRPCQKCEATGIIALHERADYDGDGAGCLGALFVILGTWACIGILFVAVLWRAGALRP
jgi:hypothetical protein